MRSKPQQSAPARTAELHDANEPVPSWIVGICGVAAVASALFSLLMFLNR